MWFKIACWFAKHSKIIGTVGSIAAGLGTTTALICSNMDSEKAAIEAASLAVQEHTPEIVDGVVEAMSEKSEES